VGNNGTTNNSNNNYNANNNNNTSSNPVFVGNTMNEFVVKSNGGLINSSNSNFGQAQRIFLSHQK
jgi:hypothetical protein